MSNIKRNKNAPDAPNKDEVNARKIGSIKDEAEPVENLDAIQNLSESVRGISSFPFNVEYIIDRRPLTDLLEILRVKEQISTPLDLHVIHRVLELTGELQAQISSTITELIELEFSAATLERKSVFAFEIPESEEKKFARLLDKTLSVLRRLEKESPKREARIAESQAEVKKIKKEIREQLAILAAREKRLDAV